MKRHLQLLVLAALAAPPRSAGGGTASLTIGVFLPTAMGDGQARFRFGEELAAALGKALRRPVTARNFARYADFLESALQGGLDLGVADTWIAAQSPDRFVPLAALAYAGETRQRWAVISRTARSLPELLGKRLAVTRGAGPTDVQFVSNVIFEGDLAVPKHFKVVFVPAVESGLRMLEVDSADAALVPQAQVPKKTRVLYRSAPVPVAVVLSLRGAPSGELRTALQALAAVAPFDRLATIRPDEVAGLRKLIAQGPPPRQPVVAESPLLRPNLRGLVTFRGVGVTYPPLLDYFDLPKDQPDE